MAILEKHKVLEKNATLLLVFSFLVVTIGGIVEIAPLFYLQNTIEKVEGMRPYTPLELKGRDIYIREGCYTCHSQMIRPMRDEVERYGHYSLAAESMYDHPFQWGSKRTGPDLARVGGRYSDEWHIDHLVNPQAVVPESIMPSYGFLLNRRSTPRTWASGCRPMRWWACPMTRCMITAAHRGFPRPGRSRCRCLGAGGTLSGRPATQFRPPPGVSEMDALIAYLQVLRQPWLYWVA
jgi:cytochrome c oxidase cbb3-type subunit 2